MEEIKNITGLDGDGSNKGETGSFGINYYKVGTREDIVVSNSSLSCLEPLQGGSPQKFLAFFDKQLEQQESRSLENGKLIHLYAEKPQEFAIATVPKPTKSMADFADEFYRLKVEDQSWKEVSIEISANPTLKKESSRDIQILAIKAGYEKLSKLVELPLEQTIALFKLSRTNTEAYTSYNEDTLIDKFISEAILYLQDLKSLENKIALTLTDKIIIENCIKSLRANPLANQYFNLGGLFEGNLIFKELDVYFELLNLKCKCRLDNIYIDLENKIIYLNDLKTTSKPISLFQESFEFYRYYRQLAFYRRALKYLVLNNLLVVTDSIDLLKTWEIKCQIIAVETTGNFDCQVFNVDRYINKGDQELKSLLERVYFHKSNNDWTSSMESLVNGGVIQLKPKEI